MFFTLNGELWKSDGTPAGTVSVAANFNWQNLTVVGTRLYLTALNKVVGTGQELFWYEGGIFTSAGDINPGPSSSNPTNLTNVGGALFFSAKDGTNGFELWKHAGSGASTLVSDINPGAGSSNPINLTDVNGLLFFVANNGTNGDELWQSDGTPTGTLLVKDIFAGVGSSAPDDLTKLNGTLIFSAFNAGSGRELWRSDGTLAGTVQILDIIPGSIGSAPQGMRKVLANRVIFAASSDSAGSELWATDGTAGGTAQIHDIAPGEIGSNPASFTVVNTDIFFVADDGGTGRELWQIAGTAVNNHPPAASSGRLAAQCDSPVSGTLSATDNDGDPLTFSIVHNGAKGVAVITNPATGTYTYTPNSMCEPGTDTFTFVANDGTTDSNVATISTTFGSGPGLTPRVRLSLIVR